MVVQLYQRLLEANSLINIVILLCFISMISQAAEKTTKASFDDIVGEKIHSGFIFVNGRYIEAPYEFSLRGLKLFVNDHSCPK